jgi:hypothetical protein
VETEQPDQNKAKAYQHQQTIKLFHMKLSDWYHSLKNNCEVFGRSKCTETPKLACLRSLRDYPPVRCALYNEGYFPLLVDKKFTEDVQIMEIDNYKLPKKVTEKHGRRFMRLFGGMGFRFVKGPPPTSPPRPSDPSDTIVE